MQYRIVSDISRIGNCTDSAMDTERQPDYARSHLIEVRKTPSLPMPTDQHCTDSAMVAERSPDYTRSHSFEERKTTSIHRHKKLELKRRHDNNEENIAQEQLKEKQQQ